jgi:hypothetical protein
MPQHPEPHIRRAVRVLSMVGELHKQGYQRLRVRPYMAPSGTAWRCTIAAADLFCRKHGAILKELATLQDDNQGPLTLHDTHLGKTTTNLVGPMQSGTPPEPWLTSSSDAFSN